MARRRDRHPELGRILAQLRRVAVHRETWGEGGRIPLELSSYLTSVRVPDELVTSVRCIITVPAGIVVCKNQREQHIWPGGCREPGETLADVAVREVAEETGWILDRDSLVYLGFLHVEHLGPRPESYSYPYPDSLQLVFGGKAEDRRVDSDAS